MADSWNVLVSCNDYFSCVVLCALCGITKWTDRSRINILRIQLHCKALLRAQRWRYYVDGAFNNLQNYKRDLNNTYAVIGVSSEMMTSTPVLDLNVASLVVYICRMELQTRRSNNLVLVQLFGIQSSFYLKGGKKKGNFKLSGQVSRDYCKTWLFHNHLLFFLLLLNSGTGDAVEG